LRINLIEQNIEEVMQRSETVQEMGLKHARVTNETMNKEINRLEKIVATLEDYQQKQLDDIKRQHINMKQDLEAWNQHYQQSLGQKVEDLQENVRKCRESQEKLEAVYDEHKVIVNKSLKLHETVIENKFKDIKL